MLPMSGAERAAMIATHNAVLWDRGHILTYQEGAVDAYGKPTPTYTPGEGIPCAYHPLPSHEVKPFGAETLVVEGTLLVPLGSIIRHRDRFQMTHHLSDPIRPLTFAIVGNPTPGVVALSCRVRSIEGGSTDDI